MICVSRPTNPTGNVITDEELIKLDALANQHGVPLVIDNAYGVPFPGIIFSDARPLWNPNIVLCMSLSKLGLPGSRCGIIIANEKIITAISNMNGIISLAPGGIGPAMMCEMIKRQDLLPPVRDGDQALLLPAGAGNHRHYSPLSAGGALPYSQTGGGNLPLAVV